MIKRLTSDKIKDVAEIHAMVLPRSPIPKLGKEFIEKFYYAKLIENNTFFCDVYEFEGKIAGFIAYTTNSKKLLRDEMKKHWWLITSIILKTILKRPSVIFVLFSTILLILKQGKEPAAHIAPEVLSFAVLPEYRSVDFYKRHQIKIAHELFKNMLEKYKQLNVREFKLFTGVDEYHTLANIFYKSFGLKLYSVQKVRGFIQNTYIGSL